MVDLRIFRQLFLRNIKTSLNRFLSIVGIVAIGVGFLGGLLATAPDMRQGVSEYYTEQNVYDIDIKSTLGLTEDDLACILENENVQTAMPAYVVDKVMAAGDGETYTTRIYGTNLALVGTDEYLNEVKLLSGRMPQNVNECVLIIPDNGYTNVFELGTVFQVNDFEKEDAEDATTEKTDDDDEFDFDDVEIEIPETTDTELLEQTSFTVVGIAESSLYYSIETEPSTVGSGSVRLVMYVPQESFSSDVYTDIFVKLYNTDETLDYFSDTYNAQTDVAVDSFSSLEEERAGLRLAEVKEEAYQKLADAQQELDDARIEVDEELAKAQKELDDALIDLQEAQDTWNEKNKEYIEGLNQYVAASAQVAEARAQLEAMRPYIDALKQAQASGVTLGPAELAQIAQFDATDAQLSATEQTLYDTGQALVNAKTQLDDGQQEINDGHDELHQGQVDLAEAQQEVEEKLADAQAQINEAYADIEDLEDPEWYFFTLEDNVAYNSYKSNTEKVGAIAKVFPVFFFLVAMLVSLTTMTRMVEEQRTQIGILKSLGYTNGNILAYYLVYGGIASFFGCVVGLLPGYIVFPRMISDAYGMMYMLPPSPTPFRFDSAIIIAVTMVVAIIVTSYFACRNILKNKPATLLVPAAPPAGKRILLERIPFIWKRFSFTQKVTARNLFRYKKRFVMTVIGVSGCTALLLTGFGIKDSISDIVTKQFNELTTYDFIVSYKDDDAFETDQDAVDFLTNEEYVAGYLPVAMQSITVSNTVGERDITLVLPRDINAFSATIHLRERKSGKAISFDENAAVITEKTAEQLNLSVGDSIQIETEDGDIATVQITGITENYIETYLYVGSAVYKDIFPDPPEFKTLYVRTNPSCTYTDDEYSAAFLKSDEVIYVMSANSLQINFMNALSSIDTIVLVLIACAGALALIVLYNLTNINIGEREKELATLKVLGFYNKEVSSYIFKEVYLLSFIGSLVGLVMGVVLHIFVIRTVEVDMAMFGRQIYLPSYLYAIAITLVFTVLVSLIMQKRLRDIDMVESMKAGE